MRTYSRWLTTTLLLALALASLPAAANTVFCIKNDASGPSAFDTAMQYWTEAVDETVYVHMEQGTYSILAHSSGDTPIGYGTGYTQDGGNYGGSGNASLHLVGGFAPGTGCKSRVIDPYNTVILGDGVSVRIFELQQHQGELLVDTMRFEIPSGVSFHADQSHVTLRNVVVTGVTDSALNDTGAALAFYVDPYQSSGNTFRAENCLIYGNTVPGLYVISGNSDDAVDLVNCTIANNGGYGVAVGDPSDSYRPFNGTFAAYNLILHGNANDIAVAKSSTKPSFFHSNFHGVAGTIGGSGNVDLPPKFVDELNGKYDLQTTSPLINTVGASAASVPGGYAGTDIRGRTRVIGSHIDLGAYESNVDDTVPQEVTLATDSADLGTLRTAIAAANTSSKPTTIKFNIPGGTCPQTLLFLNAMPDITSDVTIDGYTQPGSAPNSAVPGYNGKICIVFDGINLDHALRTTGAGRLTVRGIDFERFSGSAIRLSSGNGNMVTGNSFAADPNYTASAVGVLIDGSARNSQIGSYAFGDRNSFVRETDAAIKLTSNGAGNHLIQGNYIGFKLDGTKPSGAQNKYGIYATDSGSNDIEFNFIGASQLNALHLAGSGTSGNVVRFNAIGYAPANDAAAGNGVGTCNPLCIGTIASVELSSGAHDNFIGASDCTTGPTAANGSGNVIVNNFGPGVAIEANAGIGNRVCGNNQIYGNAGYLPIDVGTFGATANVNGGGKNYPFLSQALRVEANTIRVSGFLQTQTPGPAQIYRLDFYWTDTCVAGDATGPRGELKRYAGFLNLSTDGTLFLAPFSTTDILAATGIPSTGYLFATATNAAGSTTEPGPCFTFTDDHIFSNGLEH